ncbi:DeoR/GlpR family DNA-binding transcription regulator [Vineibacter terrae]|uniref:DeoR/GlpR family DNA-binding transcription regulator n=1 Tax=Vineibacter terrae TaxID=2586908 RepID=UPI002E328A7A|nr:DeoR/GlpR family DNA-binding transcription regulator [Vineibacter terrae]HEX2888930.1 DeoR/GlpR family DNA-binding transcription regulator [Vineibacter terrae]
MLAEERQNLILDLVNQRGSQSITDLQRQLKVSRETIRRDLMLLADRHALRKTHGGALSLAHGEPGIAVREVINAEAKRAIAWRAAGLVPDGATVLLAGGSTVQAMADMLLDHRELTVITNSVANASKLAARNSNRVHLLGGEVQTTNNITLGPDATAMLAHYFVDVAIVGAGAITPAGVLMDYTREEAEISRLMLQSARLSVVLADHTKFNRHAPVQVGTFEKVTCLISDRPPEAPLSTVLARLPLDVLIADGQPH